ncbi:MAG TPA: hypothetical protein VGO57_07755 [Verrucomicrobiae bacterium]
MKNRIRSVCILLALLGTGNLQTASAQTTAFTYQGQLYDGGMPANGLYDLQFVIYDAAADGNQIGNGLTNFTVNVNNGLFTTLLDFGSTPFDGSARWLEISVRTNGGEGFNLLTPRQPITATPYAIRASSVSATNISGGILDTQLSTNVVLLNVSPTFTGTVTATNFNGNGAGLTNVPGTLIWQLFSSTNLSAVSNTGYLITNDTQSTLTLPASPKPGDVIRISDAGLNGWRIAQNGGLSGGGQTPVNQVIKSSGGSFLSYTVWTNHANSAPWTSVVSSADGTKLAAANSGQIYTSTDSGSTWILRTNTAAGYYLASSSDGTKLVAVGSGWIFTSADSGATWTQQSPPISGSWRAVASSADGSKLVVAPSSGQIYTSPDSGVSWIARGNSSSWASIASSADGTRLIAGGSGPIYTSTNSGVNWTVRTNLITQAPVLVASSADGLKLVAAVQGAVIYTSTDAGLTWAAQNSGSRVWNAVASSSDGSRLIASTMSSSSPGAIYTSLDSGITWTVQNISSKSWAAVTTSADGSRLAAAVTGGQIYTSQLFNRASTTPGVTGYLLGGQNTAIELQYTGNGQFISLGHEGSIQAY